MSTTILKRCNGWLALLLVFMVGCLATAPVAGQPAPATPTSSDNPLPNADFEAGETGWHFKDAISAVVAEAARNGERGLRVGSTTPTKMGSHVFSARFKIEPGQKVTLDFWGKAEKKLATAGLLFQDANGRWMGKPVEALVSDSGRWAAYHVEATAPEGVATVGLWIHTYSNTVGLADIDDVVIGGLPAGVIMIPAPTTPRPEPDRPADPSAVPHRETPPVIILKLDDLKQTRGGVHARWQAVADYLDQRQIKASIGVICETLAEASPQYVDWIKRHRDTGRWELWFHGWDHAEHEDASGTKRNEFVGRSHEEQLRRFTESQQLAERALGFTFETFGPPGGSGKGGSFDEATVRAMADDPSMRVWLYPQPLDDTGRRLESEGKVVILDRVWAVNLEGGVGAPDFARFLEGYAKNLDRPYFVLQGHPAQWDSTRFAEFERIIDFLVERKAVFMTPAEFASTRSAP